MLLVIKGSVFCTIATKIITAKMQDCSNYVIDLRLFTCLRLEFHIKIVASDRNPMLL